MGAYMLFVFQRNRREFVQLRDEADDRKRIIRTHSMASVRSTTNNNNSSKSNMPRYQYTSMKSSPTNGTTAEYDSDNNSGSVLYQARPAIDQNA